MEVAINQKYTFILLPADILSPVNYEQNGKACTGDKACITDWLVVGKTHSD